MSKSVAATNQVLTLNDIQAEISSKVTRAQLILGVSSFNASTLLMKFKWDIDSLKESFHASQYLPDFLISNNLSLRTYPAAPIHPECQLCLAVEDVKGLACRHMACGFCWKSYLKNKIEYENPSIECFDCSLLISSDKLETLLSSMELFTAYQDLVVNSYVNNVSNLAWCSKKCGKAIRHTGSNNVTCSCGANFCFRCKRDPHNPASCVQMERWERACEAHLGKFADKKSCEWIQNNTQACPLCWAPIQKDGGCNYMKCGKCKQGFCWVCGGIRKNEWDGHLCRYARTQTVLPNQQKIEPYLHLFNYQEQRLGESSSLSECRRVLMYSYVYAYCQGPGRMTNDFIQLQMKLRDKLDLEHSKQRLEECEQLRMLILDCCSSNPRGKEVVKKETDECGESIALCCFLLFLLLISAVISGVIILLVF